MSKQSIFAAIVIAAAMLLAMSGAAFAAQKTAYIEAYITENHSITLSEGKMYGLNVSISIPPEAEITDQPKGAKLTKDSRGNTRLEVYEPSPGLPYRLFVNATVKVNQTRLYDLPENWIMPGYMSEYLSQNKDIPSSDPQFMALAAEASANATTPFEKISHIAKWVHEYINYDPGMLGRTPGASEVLEGKAGVCTEYTTLFVTLARSLGYPARFVNGYAYSAEQKAWLGHAWAEVYIGKWVAVDPTWLEVGRLDATHIVLSRQAVQDFRFANITARVSPQNAKLVWEGAQSRGALADNIHQIAKQDAGLEKNFTLSISSDKMPPGGKFVSYMEYEPKDYYLLEATLAPCVDRNRNDIVKIEEQKQFIATRPNRTQYIIWLGQASNGLNNETIYSCPLTFNSEYMEIETVNANIVPQENSQWREIEASVEKESLEVGQKQRIRIKLPEQMQNQTITVLEQDLKLQKEAGLEGFALIEYYPTRIGEHVAYVFAQGGNPQRLEYALKQREGIYFSEPLLDTPLFEGENGAIITKLALPKDYDAAQGLTVEWAWGGQTGSISYERQKQLISIPVMPVAAGKYPLSLRLLDSSGNAIAQQTWAVEAYPQSIVKVETEKMIELSNHEWQAHLRINTSGVVQKPFIILDGRVVDTLDRNNKFVVNMKPGKHDLSVSWHDAAGARRHLTWEIEVAEQSKSGPSVADQYAGIQADPFTSYLVSAILTLGFVVAAATTLMQTIRNIKGKGEAPPNPLAPPKIEREAMSQEEIEQLMEERVAELPKSQDARMQKPKKARARKDR